MSDSASSLQRITELVEPSLRQCGVELYHAQWSGTPGRKGGVLQLMIDKDGGVSLDDCQRVSHAVGAVLDAYDPIEGAYQLQVSSPGAERPLRNRRDWERSVGRKVNVRYRLGDSEMILEGRLLAISDTAAEVETTVRRTVTVTAIPMTDVLAARAVAEIRR